MPKTAEKKHHFIAHELLVCECGQELTQVHYICMEMKAFMTLFLLSLACPSSPSRNGLLKEICEMSI